MLCTVTDVGAYHVGTNVETIKPTLAYLRQRGILPILNYAAEEDLKHANNGEQDSVKSSEEAKYNWQHSIFMRSIKDCDNTTPAKGFVGIKVSLLNLSLMRSHCCNSCESQHLCL